MKPYLIGITGSFGTGKSFVGDILKELGFLVVDTDDMVAQILSSKNHITSQIIHEFGTTDKKKLSEIVFKEEPKRKKLESIIHPEIKKKVMEIVLQNSKENIIFVLVPLLFESGFELIFNETWCVVCDENIQMKRLLNKGFLKDEAQKRINVQFSQQEKAKRSNFIIENSSTPELTREQILKRLKELVQLNHIPRSFFYKEH